MRPSLGKILLPLLLLAAAPTLAQEGGYTVPGSLGEQQRSAREQVQRAYQDARWQLGFLHLDPRLALSDLSYVSNIYSTTEAAAESDFRAQAAAGLRGFFHLGAKVLVSPFANLGYTWWQDQTELRSFNESFGVQLFGDFNRLQLGLQGGRVETQRNLSSELEVPVDVQTDRLQADLEIDFWGPFRLFGSLVDSRVRQSGDAAEQRLPGLDLSLLDVDSELLKAGLAYELGNGLTLGAGWVESEANFPNDPDGRSNQGSGPLLRVAFDGTRLDVDLEASRRDLEFVGRRVGDVRTQDLGSARLGWKLTEQLTASLYGGARLEASAVDSTAVLEARRSGIRLSRQGTGRHRIAAFYEVGEDEFARFTDDFVTRLDDVESYGLAVTSRLGERLTVELGLRDTRRTSSDPQFDRRLTAVTSRVRLGADLLPW